MRFLLAVLSIIFGAVVCLSVCADEPSADLIKALIQVESGGNNRAVGDGGEAFGPLQIHQGVCDDYNCAHKTRYVASEDCLGNRSLSVKICSWYIRNYATKAKLGHVPTDQDKARIWNGGPSGWKKSSTQAYWKKVQKAI